MARNNDRRYSLLPWGSGAQPATAPATPQQSATEKFLRGQVGGAGQARGRGPITLSDREAEARSRGLQIVGDQAVGHYGPKGYRTYTALGQFTPQAPQTGGAGSQFNGALTQALLDDTTAMQGAADRQYGRNNQRIAGLDQFIGGINPTLMGQAQGLGGDLMDTAGRAEALGEQQMGDWTRRADGIMARQNKDTDTAIGGIQKAVGEQMPKFYGDIEGAYKRGDDAVGGFKEGVDQFENRTAQDASVVAAGIRRNAQSQMQQARSGINPDGTPMTPQQQADAIGQIQGQVNDQVQSAVTPLFSQYNTAKAQLEQALAGVKMNNASLHLQGAELRGKGVETEIGASKAIGELGNQRAQTGVQLSGQMVQAQAAQRDMMNLSAGLHQARASLESAAQLASVNLELQGRNQVAALVQQNPETVVSWFQGLLAMYSAQGTQRGVGGGSSGVKTGTAQKGIGQWEGQRTSGGGRDSYWGTGGGANGARGRSGGGGSGVGRQYPMGPNQEFPMGPEQEFPMGPNSQFDGPQQEWNPYTNVGEGGNWGPPNKDRGWQQGSTAS